MSSRDPRARATLDGFRIVLAMVAVMWAAELVDTALDHRLDQYGIEPRDEDGLVGIAVAPFLHAGFDHLIANTVPLLAMGFAIAFGGPRRMLAVTAAVVIISGLGTWLIAPATTLHIGASGLVFGYATYLLSRGFFDRDAVELAIGLTVAVLWGGALLSGLLPEQGISWQGHLFGALGGVMAARLLARQRDARAS